MGKQRVLALLSLSILILISIADNSWGQTSTGSIGGTVLDASGSTVPHASVTIRNGDTGLTRNVEGDDGGRYKVTDLPLGAYDVEISAPGFGTEVRKGISLTIGREAVVDSNLKPGQINQKVEVKGEVPNVETTNASLAYLVDDKKIIDLPLNGRSYAQLAVLQPGVNGLNLDRRDASGGYGAEMSIAGSQTTQNSFILDGQDISDSGGRTPGSAAGVNLGVDAIREFTIIVNNYSTQYGLVVGGVVNVATRSGTNTLHGSLFEFLRNSAMDAKNFFDPAAPAAIPPFRRNQFGGTIGGPIIKDKTFFMAAYEGLRQAQAQTIVSPIPNEAAHAGCLPYSTISPPVSPLPTTSDAQCARFSGINKFVGIVPLMVPRMNAMPLPNGPDNGDGTGTLTTNPLLPAREDYVLGRIDHMFSARDSIYGRYVFDYAHTFRAENIPVFEETNRTQNQYLALHWTHIFSDHLINDAHFGGNRSPLDFNGVNISSVPDSQLSILTGGTFSTPWLISAPTIDSGASGGGYNETRRTFNLNLFEYGDDANYTRGKHTVKFGVVYKRYQLNTNTGSRGQFRFNTLQLFMQGDPFIIATPARGQYSWRQNLFGWYVQDDIRITRRLTLNVGLRHEFTTPEYDVNGHSADLINTSDTVATVGPLYTPSKKNFEPRAGLAWDVFGNGKTAIRAGAGIFHEQLVPSTLRYGFITVYPYVRSISVINGTSPILDLNNLPATGAPGISRWEPNPHTPTKYQWSLDWQQQLTSNTTVTVAYIGSHAVHLMDKDERNPAVPSICPCSDPKNAGAALLPAGTKYYPVGAPRINPFFANMNSLEWNSFSSYNSMQVNLVRRFSKGLQFQGAYTWSHTIDLSSNIWGGVISKAGPESFQDPRVLTRDIGPSNSDIRHIFTGNVTYDLPFGNHLSGFAKSVIGGWQANMLLSLSTGFPLNIGDGINNSRDGQSIPSGDRPNFAPGFSSVPTSGVSACLTDSFGKPLPLGTPTLWFDPCAFALAPAGTYGNTPKNQVRGPRQADVDMSVTKNMKFTERLNLQFRAEAFNIINHPNFANMNRSLFLNGKGSRINSAGRLISTSTTSRQLQVGLKLSF
jgi:hypothetical protein